MRTLLLSFISMSLLTCATTDSSSNSNTSATSTAGPISFTYDPRGMISTATGARAARSRTLAAGCQPEATISTESATPANPPGPFSPRPTFQCDKLLPCV